MSGPGSPCSSVSCFGFRLPAFLDNTRLPFSRMRVFALIARASGCLSLALQGQCWKPNMVTTQVVAGSNPRLTVCPDSRSSGGNLDIIDPALDHALALAPLHAFDKLDSPFDSLFYKLDSSVDSLFTKLDSPFDSLFFKLDSPFDSLFFKLDSPFDSLFTKLSSPLLESRPESPRETQSPRYAARFLTPLLSSHNPTSWIEHRANKGPRCWPVSSSNPTI
jgi:hypothetical protein